jgi:hypothetical protein
MESFLWSEQSLLMARLFNAADYLVAKSKFKVTAADWESEDLAAIWEAMLENERRGQEHGLVGIFIAAPEDDFSIRQRILDLGTCDRGISNTTINLEYQIEQAFKRKG